MKKKEKERIISMMNKKYGCNFIKFVLCYSDKEKGEFQYKLFNDEDKYMYINKNVYKCNILNKIETSYFDGWDKLFTITNK